MILLQTKIFFILNLRIVRKLKENPILTEIEVKAELTIVILNND